MAFFSNSLQGIPQVGADVDVYAVDATQKFALGTTFTRQDGAKFAYGYSSAGVTKGRVVGSTYATASKTLISDACIAPASAVAVAGDNIQVGAIGSRYVEITVATVTANQFAGGYFIVGSGVGFGQTLRIKGNTATGNPATGNIRIQFYEPLTVALTTTSDVVIIGSPFNDLVVADGTNYVVAGVSVSTTTSTKQYGWFLTKGITACLQSDTTTAFAAGKAVQLSASVGGAVSIWGNAATTTADLRGVNVIGYALGISTDTNYGVVNFNL